MATLLVAFSTMAEATVFTKPDDLSLLHQADWVVDGRIEEISSASDSLIPAVDYHVRVSQWLKGESSSDQIVVRVPGGVRADGIALHLLGTPRLRVGDRHLLFLSQRPDEKFTPTQFFLGVFRAVAGDDGSTLAMRDFGGAHELALPQARALPEGLRDFQLFSQWLRDRSDGSRRAPNYLKTPNPPSSNKSIPVERFTIITSSTQPEPAGCGPNGGHPVRWFDFDGGGTVPWRGYLFGQPGLEESGLPHLETAIQAWNDVPGTPIELEFAGITAKRAGFLGLDGTNAVLFADPNDEIPGSWSGEGILALGGPWFSCQLVPLDDQLFHPILEGDIVTQDGLENFFAAMADPQSTGEELFAHELGHTLGLDHSLDPEALMFAEIHADGRGAHPTDDDHAAVQTLYGPPPELSPPSEPDTLEARIISSTKIALSWQDGSTNEDGFRIERRAEGPFRPIAAVQGGPPRYIDESVDGDTTYVYRVRAQNRAGPSPWSNEATITTPPNGVPLAPSNLRVAPLGVDRLRLTWQDNQGAQDGADTEYEYFIFIFSQGTSTWIEIPFPLSAETQSANLVGLSPDTEYRLQIRARNRFGDSQPSNSVSARTFEPDTLCTISPQALCLLDGRFQVEVDFRNQHAPNAPMTSARALPSTNQIGQFWFFDQDNIELVVKLVDGRLVNGHFWFYYGGVTDLELWVTVTDTKTNVQRIYHQEPGEFCGEADIMAFAAAQEGDPLVTPSLDLSALAPSVLDPSARDLSVFQQQRPLLAPSSSALKSISRETAGTCAVNSTTLCLLDRRLAVTLNWKLPGDEQSMEGQATNDGGDSGSFWFFDPQNTEVVIKAIDGRELNGHLWVFFGTLSNLEYELLVTDTLTGEQRIYYNSPGNTCGQADTQAFRVTAPP